MADDLEQEALDRLRDARRQKSEFDTDLREGYFFTAPNRSRDVSSSSSSRTRPKDAAELQISVGIEVAQDFATELLNAFSPETSDWIEQRAGIDIAGDVERANIEEEIGQQTPVILNAIKASGYYAAAAQAYMPDIALGTAALMVEERRAHQPISCQAVPLRELEINIGPDGLVDDRFIVRRTKARNLVSLLSGLSLPKETQRKIQDNPNQTSTVVWGYWHLWDREEDVYWQAVVLVDNKLVHSAVLQGLGSCPLLVFRFNPDPMFAFGNGPTLQSLPELRRLDETEALKIENADFQIHPPFIYPDDGVLNFSNGIEPGMGYAARPWGQGQPVAKLAFDGNVNFSEFETLRVESRIRRLHFVDQPEQAGKTPPTAEQWADERNRAKRRIGTPGKMFFKEGPTEVFLRFKWLLEQRGVIQPVVVDGRTVALVPYDPTEQAQDYQEVQVAAQLMGMNQQFFAQTGEVQVDGLATMKNLQKKMRDSIVVFREAKDIQGAVEMLAPLMGGGGGTPSDGDQGVGGMPI